MSTVRREKLKSLSFPSYAELKEAGTNMDKKVLFKLRKMDIHNCMKHFVEVEREARMKNDEGDEEQAYIFYSRMMEIFRVINDKMNEGFKRSPDARYFHDLSNKGFIALSELSENLKSRFAELEKQKIVLEPTPQKIDKLIDDIYINPKDIVQFLQKSNSVLVIDFRKDQSNSIEYKGGVGNGALQVVSLDPEMIVYGSLLQSLTKALDISMRPLLEQISHFDMVVLLGDLGDIKKGKGTKTDILYEALTTYNIRTKLKRPPTILERGFNSWELVYPVYVAKIHDTPRFEKTFDEKFSIWMAESQNANKVNAHYPDLAENSNSVKMMPNGSKNHNDGSDSIAGRQQMEFSSSKSIYPKSEDLQRPISQTKFADVSSQCQPKPSANFPNMPQNDRNVYADRGTRPNERRRIPSIDRAKKPVEPISGSYRDASSSSSSSSSNLMDNKENRTPAAIRSALPQVLGGARVAELPGDAPASNASAPTAVAQQPARPPTPDRSTKAPIFKAPQQTDSESFFNKSYQMAFEQIYQDSVAKAAKTRLGHTGLINMGNTCFMNATLQALFHTPYFSPLFRNKAIASHINTRNNLGTSGIISGYFSALMDLVWLCSFSAIRPFSFLKIFSERVNSALADRQQHDAQEFQIYLLDALHEDTNRVDKRIPFEQNYDSSNLIVSAQDFLKKSKMFSSSPVNDIFNLTTVSVLQCKSCSTTSVRFEGLNQISVELPTQNGSGRPLRLRDCLRTHFSLTTLDAPWDCPSCKQKQMATRTTKIWNIPKVLIIHLKRFSLNAGTFVKNETEVSFEIDGLDLAPHLHAKASPGKARYNLYAITNHSGNLNSGHYTSCVLNLAEKEWLHFDDERCSRSNIPASTSKHAFLLYYALDTSNTMVDTKTYIT